MIEFVNSDGDSSDDNEDKKTDNRNLVVPNDESTTKDNDQSNLSETYISTRMEKIKKESLYPWECVSLLKKNGQTVDFQI